ncbi:hypothetical protein mRhiFer1_009160 [Rhinolophus ferrumequinum]|uniref:Uncharacterized protein n=1 Tax=Rhinolophus ferrumequinum TaxID=59479 RepID=A0A7J7SJ48_RHIFE|nr:hypothetical protein mRhiFer1_009160 [Rhinolophus ferrumequinum]
MYSQGPGMGWGSSRISNTGPEKAQPQLPAGPSFSPPNVRFLLSPDPHGYVGSRPQGRKKCCRRTSPSGPDKELPG